eukprot:9475235-Pyramimonas_sp.AAC.1
MILRTALGLAASILLPRRISPAKIHDLAAASLPPASTEIRRHPSRDTASRHGPRGDPGERASA